MLTRRQNKFTEGKFVNDDVQEWIAVRFKADNILYMCPVEKGYVKVGSNYMIEWKDGFKYKANILMRGIEKDVKYFLSKLNEPYSISKSKQKNLQINNYDNPLSVKEGNFSKEHCNITAIQNQKGTDTDEVLSNTTNICPISVPNDNPFDISNQQSHVAGKRCSLTAIRNQKDTDIDDVLSQTNNNICPINDSKNDSFDITIKQNHVDGKYCNVTGIQNQKDPVTVEWIAVRFKDDNLLYMCPVEKSYIKVGSNYMIEWKDGFKYKANILMRGVEKDVKYFLSKLNEPYSISKSKQKNLQINNYDNPSSVKEGNFSKEHCNITAIQNQKDTDTDGVLSQNTNIYPINVSNNNSFDISIQQNHVTGKYCNATAIQNPKDTDADVSPNKHFLDICVEQNNLAGEFYNDVTATQIQKDTNIVSEPLFDQLTQVACSSSKPEETNASENLSGTSVFDFNDSGSEYLPPYQMHNDHTDYINTDDDTISLKSDIGTDESSNLFTPSSLTAAIAIDSSKSILDPKTTKFSKNLRTGYNFNAKVKTSSKKPITNKRQWDKTDCCIYCEKTVTNFTRHIRRNHFTEIEVARYFSYPKGSQERLLLADQLRKRGNFLCNVGAEQIQPVRRPNVYSEISSNATDYLPCKHCYGLYKNSYLYRHEKICKSSKAVRKGRNNARVDGQNLLMTFIETDEQLFNEVFPRMAADEISAVAKTDTLIRSFGSRYLKSHKEKHLINIVSQKMRTLSRLLIIIKKEDSEIRTLEDCLAPKYFDLVVRCTKVVAGYDASNDKFCSPSIVLKMGSALKQCCDIAEFNILKKLQIFRIR